MRSIRQYIKCCLENGLSFMPVDELAEGLLLDGVGTIHEDSFTTLD